MDNNALTQSFQRLAALQEDEAFWEMCDESRSLQMRLKDYRDRYNSWLKSSAAYVKVQPSVTSNRPDAAIGISQQNCPRCNASASGFVRQAGKHPHGSKLVCGQCFRFIKWLPKRSAPVEGKVHE